MSNVRFRLNLTIPTDQKVIRNGSLLKKKETEPKILKVQVVVGRGMTGVVYV